MELFFIGLLLGGIVNVAFTGYIAYRIQQRFTKTEIQSALVRMQ